MCGIVGGIAGRDITPILIEGLKRLEYRGYDSAGMAIVKDGEIQRLRALGKIVNLEAEQQKTPICGYVGIAHTRWATHGVPALNNAHPHLSGDVAVVHNGIIENFAELKKELEAQGYVFSSETDTEVVAHLLARELKTENDFVQACRNIIQLLEGAYALGLVHSDMPDVLVTARKGSPLCIGLGVKENFIASDVMALLPVTSRFMFLEDDDFAVITRESIKIEDINGKLVTREEKVSELSADAVSMGDYKHYMEKEIHEQAQVVKDTISGKISKGRFIINSLGPKSVELLDKVKAVHIIACGTSYHSASVARYWVERYAELPCHVEVASEYRYRNFVVPEGTLFITISQSGETADTLAALSHAKTKGYCGYLGICNVPESSLTRESDLVFLTEAGPEKSVASTKAFTTQLAALLLVTDGLAQAKKIDNGLSLSGLENIEALIAEVLAKQDEIKKVAEHFGDKHHTLFLGRGALYPVALEGALKLKEITYIHAEGYPAGELKHGPLALVDEDMPVVTVAPNDELMEKLKSNLQEVRARGGELFVFADESTGFKDEDGIHVIKMPHCSEEVAPIIYTLPLQLLSYYVAVLRGTDVDQPRNLAKSVTVE